MTERSALFTQCNLKMILMFQVERKKKSYNVIDLCIHCTHDVFERIFN